MPKKLVIQAAFRYIDANGQRRRAFRGETINISKKEADRGELLGVFGTPSDLVPTGPDEGVVDLPSESPTGTPVVPLVSKAAILEAALRERLGVEPGANEAAVLAALDAALAGPQTPTDTDPPQTAAAAPTVVNLPPHPDDAAQGADEGEPGDPDEDDEGQADGAGVVQVERPPLSATKKRWEDYAVSQGMPAGEAKAKQKPDLIALYGGA